jgi:hypothetical protein
VLVHAGDIAPARVQQQERQRRKQQQQRRAVVGRHDEQRDDAAGDDGDQVAGDAQPRPVPAGQQALTEKLRGGAPGRAARESRAGGVIAPSRAGGRTVRSRGRGQFLGGDLAGAEALMCRLSDALLIGHPRIIPEPSPSFMWHMPA